MKVVLDTNVIISGLLVPDGPPGEIIHLWIENKLTVVLSQALIEEYLEVISRPKFKNMGTLLDRQDILINLIELNRTVFVNPKESLVVIQDDPEDNRVLECAAEGAAEFIISGDSHLLGLKEFRRIRIVTPAEFLKSLTHY
ncbi:MAG: putative toxin-antitoxin system toxin component, PIN family [Bacillota bacterium]